MSLSLPDLKSLALVYSQEEKREKLTFMPHILKPRVDDVVI